MSLSNGRIGTLTLTKPAAARQQDVSDDLNAHWQAAKDEESEEKQKMGEALLEEIKNLKAELVQLQQRWDEEDATRELLEIDVSMEQD